MHSKELHQHHKLRFHSCWASRACANSSRIFVGVADVIKSNSMHINNLTGGAAIDAQGMESGEHYYE